MDTARRTETLAHRLPGTLLVLLAVALVTLPSSQARAGKPWARDPELRALLGPRVVDVIDDAERAEIVRVEGARLVSSTPSVAASRPAVGGYPQVGAFRPLSRELLEAFQEVLLERLTYEFPAPGTGIGKLCGGFRPGVALRFWPKMKAGGKKAAPGKPADILLCFNCSELASVPERPNATLVKVEFDPGRLALLQLAAAALPELEELSWALVSEQSERGRDLQFNSMFPADVLVAFAAASKSWATGRENEAAALLRRHVAGKALFVLSAQALGRKGGGSGIDAAQAAVYAAARTLTPAEVNEGLEAIRGDQVALDGAWELLRGSGLAKSLDAATRAAWEPLLFEASIINSSTRGRCVTIDYLPQEWGSASVPTLLRLRRGHFPPAPRSSLDPPTEPSVAGCAAMALADVDGVAARAELAAWTPRDPLDVLAARAAAARLGDRGPMDAKLFTSPSVTISLTALKSVEAHPSVLGLDLLVAHGFGNTLRAVQTKAEEVFLALTGMKASDEWGRDPAKRAADVGAWWRDHREAWKPPASAASGRGAR